MSTYTNNGVTYSGINQPLIKTSATIGTGKYVVDEENNIIDQNISGEQLPAKQIINAIDINWNNATINGKLGPIKTTSDLLNVLASKGSGSGGDSNSIPLYDSETINNLRNNNTLPNRYVEIDSSLSSNDSLNMISQLMFTINELQKEIVKIKNTFNKGIYSYNGEATYMSNTVAQYGDDEEPLWAIDESELNEIEGFEFNYENNNIFEDLNEILSNCEENRMYAYITSPSNLDITLKSENENTFNFNISDYVTCEKCNIMILLSRKPSNKEYPHNFIYITITDYVNNKTLLSGYINDNKEIVINEYQLEDSYYFNKINLLEGNFDKFNIYVQDKEFSNEVLPAVPDDDETSYRVAHIAIRTVKNIDVLKKIKTQLVNGEFIVNEETENLYLKVNNKIINIGAASGGDDINGDDPTPTPTPDDPEIDTMKNYEIIQALEAQGILSVTFKNNNINQAEQKYNPSNIKTYKLNNIGSVRFTHEDTGKVYEYKTNAYGELESKLIEDNTTLAEKLQGAEMFNDYKSSRGFVGQLGRTLAQRNNVSLDYNKDYGLYSDRIKIGAIYGPLNTDVTYGCSHAFIELENTSDTDFNLDGCKLHFIKRNENNGYYVKNSLDLTGIIPAGGTYLIRGKKYIKNDEDSNCFIHVNKYDQEWYVNGELLDLTMNKNNGSYVLIMSYHGKVKTLDGYNDFLNPDDVLYKLNEEITEDTLSVNPELANYLGWDIAAGNSYAGDLVLCYDNNGATNNNIVCQDTNDTAIANAPLVYAKGFIDALAFNKVRFRITNAYDALVSNNICRGTYELDPAKQAYNSFTMRDSSRNRWAKKGNDFQYLDLNKRYIEFPKSPTTRDVDYYSPKASFEHKNVITDKTKFNKEKPNAVTVSFGENIYTTRCFNWLSASNTDEYVWVYDQNGTQVGVFESYKTRNLTEVAKKDSGIKQADVNLYNDVHKYNPGDENYISSISVIPAYSYDKEYYEYTINNSYPRRKEFPKDVNNIVYCDYRINDVIDRSNKNKDVSYKKYATAKRACGLFAGSNDFYVSHKCVIEFAQVTGEEQKYSYIVGQADKNKKPLEGYCSERRYFTLYPKTYSPVIYQITDQQGFHWIEYQVWAAAAQSLNQKITNEFNTAKQNGNPIIPIILNTGDCTQSGARVNEWLDYFIAGDVLFDHFEQNNLVGNNDLNCTDIQALGTGDDPGKSNGYYFYLFNCNDVNNFYGGTYTFLGDNDESNPAHYPIINNTYVPSLYYLDTDNCRIIMCNSEITPINCRDWFNLRTKPYLEDITSDITDQDTLKEYNAEYTINIYTGFNLIGNAKKIKTLKYVANTFGFTPIYTLLWHAFNKNENNNRKCMAACHEMPFTVITNACCTETKQLQRFRSMSDAGSAKLIGSHMNQMEPSDDITGVYWFSRLLESSGVKLCIGGHKHTYAISYPIREYYKYKVIESGQEVWKNSRYDGPMQMEETLENDVNVVWKWNADVSDSSDPNKEYTWYNTLLKQQSNKYYKNDADNPINWSKLPLTYVNHEINSDLLSIDKFYPATPIYPSNSGDGWDGFRDKAVTYIMCQATGYKLTSNKELPTPNQKFSRIIPMTFNSTDGDTPDNNQKFPMYIKYILSKDNNDINCNVYLGRAANIFNAKYKFTQAAYGTKNIEWHYLIDKDLYDADTDRNNIIITTSYDSSKITLAQAIPDNVEIPSNADDKAALFKTYTDRLKWENGKWYLCETNELIINGNSVVIYETMLTSLKPYINNNGFWEIDTAKAQKNDADVYDNYGLWLNNEKQMIETIKL